MVSITEALQIVLQHTSHLPTEEVPLLKALGRIICEDVHAPWDIPASDNSAMDGYAFCHSALQGNNLKVTGFLAAGMNLGSRVSPGEAVKIMTGAPIPAGCDTVVPQEEVEETAGGILLKGEIKPGSHIRKQGEEARANELAITAGTRLRPQEIGMLATLGMSSAIVRRSPRVAVLATGDELLEPGAPLTPGKIINSNSYSIAAQVTDAGGEPFILGIAGDDRETTRAMIRAGLEYDLLITSGGVSVGERDFVKEVIAELGGEMKFWKVNMKPGKPLAFALVEGKPVFALPGNPVAAMVTFETFVRPALLQMMGHQRIYRPRLKALLTEEVKNKGDRPHLVRVMVEERNGEYVVAATGNQSSSRLSSLTSGNALLYLEAGEILSSGTAVQVSMLDQWFEVKEFFHDAG